MANTKALQSIVSLPGKLGTMKSYAPTWGRASAIDEHGSGEASFSPLAPTPNQALSRFKVTPGVGARHTGMSIHYEIAPNDRRHLKRKHLGSPRFA